MASKAISLKYQLSGEVDEFLDHEEMRCTHTKDGVVELINQISAYKEEGKSLFPEVFIFDSLDFVRQALINSEFVKIGKAERAGKVILKALKTCAPLATGGWCIYILRDGGDFEFGLFRAGATIISIPISTFLFSGGDQVPGIILVRQVADKIVEVQGVKGNSLIINFGIKSTSNLSPLGEQAKFVERIIEKTDDSIKDQVRVFLKRLFLFVMQNGHGNLCVIVAKGEEYPAFLTDGIVLNERISVSDRIAELNKVKNEQSSINILEVNSKLNGVFNLVAGMLMSDGITVFSDDCDVCAFNVFMKHPEDDEDIKKVEGGARSRTYAVMKKKLSNTLKAVYMQSQDGKIQTDSYE